MQCAARQDDRKGNNRDEVDGMKDRRKTRALRVRVSVRVLGTSLKCQETRAQGTSPLVEGSSKDEEIGSRLGMGEFRKVGYNRALNDKTLMLRYWLED
jgi:hypothetical protein